MLNDKLELRTAGIKAPHIARFQRHHCRSTAPVLLCGALAGIAIQAT